MLLTQRFLLPHRDGESLPSNFSAHAQTLVEQYRIEDGLHSLRVRASSPYVGQPREAVDLKEYPGLNLIAIYEGGHPLKRPAIAEGDVILVHGESQVLWRALRPTSISRCAPRRARAPSPRRCSTRARVWPKW